MSPADRERRRARRIRFATRVLIRTREATVPAEANSRDISLRGIYLVPEQHIPVETPCTLEIALEGDSSRMTLSVSGVVCRHDQDGTAIAFVELEEGTALHIANLVRLHGGKPTTPPVSPCQGW